MPLMTCETVPSDTSASRAMSWMVVRLFGAFAGFFLDKEFDPSL